MARVVFLIQTLLVFGGRSNRSFYDIRLTLHRLLNFNMLFQFLPTEFSKSKLFSCFEKVDHVTSYCKRPIGLLIAELHARERSPIPKKMWSSPHPRNFGNHVIVRPTDRPSAPQAYQSKIIQSTGMSTQTQLEVFLAGNRIATLSCEAKTTKESIKTKTENTEIVSVSVLC